MSFWEHFDELRRRLVICLWIFFAGFLGLYFVSDHLLDFLRKPLFDLLPAEQQHLYYTNLFENFLVHLKVAAYASVTLFSPIFVYVLWGFIAPGLTVTERKVARPFLFFAAIFFIVGAGFAYFFLFPLGVKYFLAYGTSKEVPLLTLESYVSLVLKILFGFGLVFELPVVLILLGKVGILTAENLEKNRRMAIIVIATLAAVVAPPDALSMITLMVPLYLLFESAVFVLKRMEKSPKAKPVDTTQS